MQGVDAVADIVDCGGSDIDIVIGSGSPLLLPEHAVANHECAVVSGVVMKNQVHVIERVADTMHSIFHSVFMDSFVGSAIGQRKLDATPLVFLTSFDINRIREAVAVDSEMHRIEAIAAVIEVCIKTYHMLGSMIIGTCGCKALSPPCDTVADNTIRIFPSAVVI